MMGPRRLPGSSPGRAVVDAPSALRRARVGWRRPLAAILVIGLACVTASCLASRPVVLAVLRVSPPAAAVMVGDSVQLSARVEDGGGNQLSMSPVTWWSNDTSVATVTAGGLVTAVGPGTATITATSAGDSAGAEIRVSAHRPGTVSDLAAGPVTDSSLTLAFTEVSDGTGRPASYDIRYAAGPFSWGSAKSVTSGTCATPLAGTSVGSKRACSVLGLAAGTTYSFELVAFRGRLNGKVEFGELSNTATGTTAPSTAPVASVSITPRNAWVLVGGTLQLAVTLKDAKGNTLTGRTVNWTSSDSAVAKASTTGRVTGVELGSATITAESEGLSDSALVTVVAAPPPVTYYRTNFTDGTTGPLDVYAYGNGSCAKSTDYKDPGSAYSIKCTIPGGTGAAALQVWFGKNKLAGLPKDPSLDQDLFEEVRFVLAAGAATAIGGTTCTGANRNSQFKVHKSVYGQVGSAWNGWVMAGIGACGSGPIGIYSEAEMWNIDGLPHAWPNTFPSVNEGTVYDVVYRYHRYTAQNCGTIAEWVNGTKVWDSPCLSYIGTTNGSAQGLLFWDGAVYLQNGLDSYSVYNLFAQATNYPIGAAAAPGGASGPP